MGKTKLQKIQAEIDELKLRLNSLYEEKKKLVLFDAIRSGLDYKAGLLAETVTPESRNAALGVATGKDIPQALEARETCRNIIRMLIEKGTEVNKSHVAKIKTNMTGTQNMESGSFSTKPPSIMVSSI